MTFQVALIGSDGYVLASDTKRNEFGGAEQFRFSNTTTKLSFDEQKGLAWCVAGDSSAVLASQKFRELLRNEPGDFSEIPDLLRRAGESAWRECFAGSSSTRDNIRVQRRLTIVKSNGEKTKGWTLDLFQTPDCEVFLDKMIAGDAANLASFFPECFYPVWSKRLPVKQLKAIAAATILFGHRLNPTGVYGLEMLICEAGKMTHITQENNEAEIVALEKSALNLYEYLRHYLLDIA